MVRPAIGAHLDRVAPFVIRAIGAVDAGGAHLAEKPAGADRRAPSPPFSALVDRPCATCSVC
jgi:hypothetical protein